MSDRLLPYNIIIVDLVYIPATVSIIIVRIYTVGCYLAYSTSDCVVESAYKFHGRLGKYNVYTTWNNYRVTERPHLAPYVRMPISYSYEDPPQAVLCDWKNAKLLVCLLCSGGFCTHHISCKSVYILHSHVVYIIVIRRVQRIYGI